MANKTVFIRLLRDEDKGKALHDAIYMIRRGLSSVEDAQYRGEEAFGGRVSFISPVSFGKVPNSPFAYWFPEGVRDLFKELPPFEGQGRTAKQGLATADDFRYVRLWWEVPSEHILNSGSGPDWRNDLDAFRDWCSERTKLGKYWVPFAKGGEYSPYYSDIHLVVNWKGEGEELKKYADSNTGRLFSRPQNIEYYFRPGLTWPMVTVKGLNVRTYSAGCIFSHKGPAVFFDPFLMSNVYRYLSLMNSSLFQFLVFLQNGSRAWEVGLIRNVPLQSTCIGNDSLIKSEEIVKEKMRIDSIDEITHCFKSFSTESPPASLCDGHISISQTILHKYQRINKLSAGLSQEIIKGYQLEKTIRPEDLKLPYEEKNKEGEDGQKDSYSIPLEEYTSRILSYLIGIIFSRWDIRIPENPFLAPKLADPFDPLPVCPPGMLVGSDGLPAESGKIVSEEWLRERPNAITLPPEGSVKNPTISDSEYPIEVAWNGILVDDPYHKEDIIGRMRQSFQVIWKEKVDSIEQEACEILGITDLRDYFRRPSGFFADHLKRYSKSRRQAPIYWPLSTTSGSYTLWIYYPRLTDQTIYRCVNDYINPKLEHIAREIELQQTEIEKSKTMKARQELEDLLNQQQELKEFKSEMLRVAELPYKPDLNDGVLITASPLHKLFRLAKWKKDLKKCWENLEKGDYDWAYLAYGIWPDRVREKCRKDRSLAIAHDLEDICEVSPKVAKKKPKKANKKGEEQLGLI